jgi:phosphoribosylformimino-5-aminoimidazole carboxamide ribotide isomerase
VIDLLNGVVVHAKKGERSHYHPITSSLTKSTRPIDIVKAFMDVYPFKTLYIADLNAIQTIENTGTSHFQCLVEIVSYFPNLKLWIDAGINTKEKATPWNALNAQLVLGSESFSNIEQYQTLASTLNNTFTLSLDFTATGYQGPIELIQEPQHWPTDLIIMTLQKVGANTGTDLNTIKHIITKEKAHHFYAAGGVRNINDLQQLKQLSLNGALIASALHNKQISSHELQHLEEHE